MSFTRSNPAALRAYRARWRDVWERRLAAGAASPDEEERERRLLLLEVAGVQSSANLDRTGYAAVMMAMGAELGYERDPHLRDGSLVSKQRKIEAIARELRPDAPDVYIRTVLERTVGDIDDARPWHRQVDADQLHRLMLTLVSQQRRQARAKDTTTTDTSHTTA